MENIRESDKAKEEERLRELTRSLINDLRLRIQNVTENNRIPRTLDVQLLSLLRAGATPKDIRSLHKIWKLFPDLSLRELGSFLGLKVGEEERVPEERDPEERDPEERDPEENVDYFEDSVGADVVALMTLTGDPAYYKVSAESNTSTYGRALLSGTAKLVEELIEKDKM